MKIKSWPKTPSDISRWQWMRVYYFEDCKDDLIVQAVWPALRNMIADGEATGAYFERDWIAGPNVLIGLNSAAGARVLEQAMQPIHEYLAKYPSRTHLEANEFRRRNKISAALESRRPEDAAMNPSMNNTIALGCEEPFSPLLRPGLLQETVRRFRCRSSSIVIGWLELIRSGAWQRQQIAMQAMISLAWVANPQTFRSHISFRSHAYGFLRFMNLRSNVRWEEKFARHYANGQGDATRRLLSDSLQTLQRQEHPLPGINEYLLLLREMMIELHAGLVDGRYIAPALREIGSEDSSRSGHRINLITRKLLGTNVVLQTWRIAINLVYLMLNQLGLPALERYLACYLITRAAEDVFDEPAASIVEELAGTGDVGRVISFFSGDGHAAAEARKSARATEVNG